MKIKKKLKDLTEKEYVDFKESLCDSCECCKDCLFNIVECSNGLDGCWINHKNMFSDKFLNQEIEIEVPDLLTKEDKEYLEVVIKPLKDIVESITKFNSCVEGYEHIDIYYTSHVPSSIIYFKKGSLFKNLEHFATYTLKDLGLIQNQKKKITLTEFWNSNKDLAIHCDTKEKAHQLLFAFDKMGMKWRTGGSYLSNDNWNEYNVDTCYSNYNGYGCIKDCHNYNHIYDFDEVDLNA